MESIMDVGDEMKSVVLARKVGESVVIRDAEGNYLATVTIQRLQRGKGGIRFTGPRSVRFIRAEHESPLGIA